MAIQSVAEKVTLEKRPVPIPSSSQTHGEYQGTGETVPLNKTPVAIPSANPGNKGQIQSTGETVELNRTPVIGFQNIPMCDQVKEQAKGKY
jgi:hypothetical protein